MMRFSKMQKIAAVRATLAAGDGVRKEAHAIGDGTVPKNHAAKREAGTTREVSNSAVMELAFRYIRSNRTQAREAPNARH
jgi:hypothetical protein